MAASQTNKPANPDEDPARLDESADLAGIHAVADNLNLAFGIPGALPAKSTMIGTKIFKARRVSTLGA